MTCQNLKNQKTANRFQLPCYDCRFICKKIEKTMFFEDHPFSVKFIRILQMSCSSTWPKECSSVPCILTAYTWPSESYPTKILNSNRNLIILTAQSLESYKSRKDICLDELLLLWFSWLLLSWQQGTVVAQFLLLKKNNLLFIPPYAI